jgi:hypothetical protein
MKTKDELILELERDLQNLDAKYTTILDEKLKVERRLEKVLRFLADHSRSLAELEAAVHDVLIAGGKW